MQEQLGKRLEEPFSQTKEKEKKRRRRRRRKEEEINICSRLTPMRVYPSRIRSHLTLMEDGGAQSSVKTGKDGYTPEPEEFWDHLPM